MDKKQKDRDYSKIAKIDYIVASICYVTSIIWFFTNDSMSSGALWMSIATVYLSLGIINSKKTKEDKHE